jgi:hypothetical protein
MDESKRATDIAWRRFVGHARPQAGIALIGHDSDAIDRGQLAAARSEWLRGMPLWLEGAPAAMAGAYYCAGLPPQTAGDPERLNAQDAAQIAAQRALIKGNVLLQPGLGLLPACFEPRVLEQAGWARLFALAYEHPVEPAFALGANTTLTITENRAEVIGEESIIALDLRNAVRAAGDNRAYVIANGLLDVYAPGERVEPEMVD